MYIHLFSLNHCLQVFYRGTVIFAHSMYLSGRDAEDPGRGEVSGIKLPYHG